MWVSDGGRDGGRRLCDLLWSGRDHPISWDILPRMANSIDDINLVAESRHSCDVWRMIAPGLATRMLRADRGESCRPLHSLRHRTASVDDDAVFAPYSRHEGSISASYSSVVYVNFLRPLSHSTNQLHNGHNPNRALQGHQSSQPSPHNQLYSQCMPLSLQPRP